MESFSVSQMKKKLVCLQFICPVRGDMIERFQARAVDIKETNSSSGYSKILKMRISYVGEPVLRLQSLYHLISSRRWPQMMHLLLN